jgi:O-antigen/teichoic acid export membrane protein
MHKNLSSKAVNFSVGQKVSRNIISNFTGTLVILIVGFFLFPFVVHRIGANAFGIWMLVNGIIGYMGILDLGLTPTVVKKSAEYLAKGDKEALNSMVNAIFTIYLYIGAVVALVIFGLSFVTHRIFNISPQEVDLFRMVLWIVGLQITLKFPFSIWHGLMAGLQDFHVINGINIGTNLVKALVTILLLISGFGLLSLIWLGFVLALAGWIINVLWVKHQLPFLRMQAIQFNIKMIKNLARFSTIMFLWQIVIQVLTWTDRIIIGLFLPVASITIYEIGTRINIYSRHILNSVVLAVMPASSELSVKEELAVLQHFYIRGTKYVLAIYVPVVLALLIYGKEFINLWMGKRFEQSVWIMYVLLIGSLYQSQNSFASAMLIGMDVLKTFSKILIAYPIANIAFSLVFIKFWGLIGVAVATSLTFLIMETIFLIHAIKIFEIRILYLLKSCYIPVTLSVILTVVLSKILFAYHSIHSWPSFVVQVLSFLVFYFIMFLAIGTSRKERENFKYFIFELLKQVRLQNQ